MKPYSKQLKEPRDTDFRWILPAAGLSRRFPAENKLLTDFFGEALCVPVFRAVGSLCRTKDHMEGLVVTNDMRIGALAKKEGLSVTDNPDAIAGQSASIRTGIRWQGWSGPSEGYTIFLPADQPLMIAEDLIFFTAQIQAGDKGLWRSHAGERFGSPAAFHARYHKQLLSLTGDRGGRELFTEYPEDTGFVELRADALEDVDTPEDLARLVKKKEQENKSWKSI